MIVDWLIDYPVFSMHIPQMINSVQIIDCIKQQYNNSNIRFYISGKNDVIEEYVPYVAWEGGYVTIRKLDKYEDAISLHFSGCYMAKFEDAIGNKYVSHIHNGGLHDNKLQQFLGYCVLKDFRNIVLFKPYYADYPEFIAQMNGIANHNNLSAVGIIEDNGNCYSAYILDVVNEPNLKCICRIIQHMNPLRIGHVINPEQYHIAENHYHVIYNR